MLPRVLSRTSDFLPNDPGSHPSSEQSGISVAEGSATGKASALFGTLRQAQKPEEKQASYFVWLPGRETAT
jgi:hypothetical protein